MVKSHVNLLVLNTISQMNSNDINPTGIDQHRIQFSCISGAFVGIVTAGFCYPSCIALIVAIAEGWQIGIPSIEEAIAGAMFIVFFGGIFGFMLSATTGLVSVLLIYWMNRSVGYPLDARSAAISTGSLAGYLPTAWVVFVMPGWDATEVAITAALGPILAMSLGAIGAAWSSKRYAGIHYELARHHIRSRISILNLMMATAWIAVTFATANLFGGPNFAIAVGVWFVLQSLMLAAVVLYKKAKSSRQQTRK